MKLLIKIQFLSGILVLAWNRPVNPIRPIWSGRVTRADVL
jgi:hypothetical protein